MFSQPEAEHNMEVTNMVLVTRVQGKDRITCALDMKLEIPLSICGSHVNHITRDISMYFHV
jgi:hypothetical protein